MITHIGTHKQERIPIEYRFPIRLLTNVRRSIAQRYNSVRHLPNVTHDELYVLIGMYQIMYMLEDEYRALSGLTPLTGLPKWASDDASGYVDVYFG